MAFDAKKRASELGLAAEYENLHIRRTAIFRERLKPSPMQSHEIDVLSFGWSPEKVAEIAGCSVATAKKWLVSPPPLLAALLRLANGELHGVGAEWQGFRVSRYGLHHPDWAYAIPADELRGLYVKTLQAAQLGNLLADAESLVKMYRALFSSPAITTSEQPKSMLMMETT